MVKVNCVVYKKNDKINNKYFWYGVFSAVFLILVVFKFVPLTEFNLSIIGDIVKPTIEPAGTRLFILGVHIHHYMFGLFLIAFSYFAFLNKKINSKLALFLYGFGSVLVLDQAHFLLGFAEFGV